MSSIGGPAQKTTFFQVVQKSFLSVPIYCSRCKYDSLDFFFKNIAWNLSVECVKHENVGSGRFSSRFLPGFYVVCLFLTLNMVPIMIVPLYIDIEQTVIHSFIESEQCLTA